jgi:hypothetical protein
VSSTYRFAILCLVFLVIPLGADDPETKSIDAATIAAYKKVGAKRGGFVLDGVGILLFAYGDDLPDQVTPGFGFKEALPKGKLPKAAGGERPFRTHARGQQRLR